MIRVVTGAVRSPWFKTLLPLLSPVKNEICVHLRLNSIGQKILIDVTLCHVMSRLVIFGPVRKSMVGLGLFKTNRAKCSGGL